MQSDFIPLSVPNFCGNEKKYVNDAVVSEWVSTGGSMVSGFEEALASYVSMPRAVACNSGTSGLHLALLVAGIKSNHEVIAPALTFIAAINPIRYVGAEPVFFGCDDTLCIDMKAVEEFCENNCTFENSQLRNNKTNRIVSAIMPVHVFGNICDMSAVMRIAKKYNLKVIEDATEALGSYFVSGEFAGKMAGTIGDIGVYSFNGNKLITTGSGGMIVSNNNEYLEKAKYLSTQAKNDELQFIHDEIGYNYRLTNLQAALGIAQLENIEKFIGIKNENYEKYRLAFACNNNIALLPFIKDIRCNCWFYSLYLENCKHSRDEMIQLLAEQNIQTRPIWALINEQKPYLQCEAYALSKAERYRKYILNIPCSTSLNNQQLERVASAICELTKEV